MCKGLPSYFREDKIFYNYRKTKGKYLDKRGRKKDPEELCFDRINLKGARLIKLTKQKRVFKFGYLTDTAYRIKQKYFKQKEFE